jgi:hypothetical protein
VPRQQPFSDPPPNDTAPTSPLATLDVADVLATVEPGIRRLLERRGLGPCEAEGGAADAWADEAPLLAGLAAGSVQGTVARAFASPGASARGGRGAPAGPLSRAVEGV